MNVDVARVKKDLKYILINYLVMKIPSWNIRRFFLKCAGMKIGEKARIGISSIVVCPERITIGPRTIINERCHLDGRGGLQIGKDVSISSYSVILTASHRKSSSGFEYFENPVIIEDYVWLGTRAMILDNSFIKKAAVLSAGVVFKGEAKENTVYFTGTACVEKPRRLEGEYEIHYSAYFR